MSYQIEIQRFDNESPIPIEIKPDREEKRIYSHGEELEILRFSEESPQFLEIS